ncbi:MAG: TonB-dependent receptor domain-containing protein [Longimicrobiales bacterium]
MRLQRIWPGVIWSVLAIPVAGPIGAQVPQGAAIEGRVLDAQTRLPVEGALIRLEYRAGGVLSDSLGRFRIDNAAPGPQVIVVQHIGYAAVRETIVVPVAGVVERDLLVAESALVLPSLHVTADATSRARGELGTATVAGREAIRHQTAVSVAGVLANVPGAPLQAPGLDGVQQFALRAAATTSTGNAGFGASVSDLASFGTLVVMDGVPVSNNANLQAPGAGADVNIVSSAFGGVDLRAIPASTLDRVEVIRGVPSARYGDLTQGAVIIETHAATVAPEIKGQYDARTAGGSVLGGTRIGPRHAITGNLDVTRTATAAGLTEDEAYRFAGQLMHRLELGEPSALNESSSLDTRIDFFQLVDDRPRDPDTRPAFESSNRDRGLRVSSRLRMTLGANRVSVTGAYAELRQSSEAEADHSRPPLPITSALGAGRNEGQFVQGRYIAETSVDGVPRLFYLRAELARELEAFGGEHLLRGGIETRREWNRGPGYQFDIVNPPFGSYNGVNGFARPRRNDDVPGIAMTSLYLDDRIAARLGHVSLNVQAGLRADLFQPGSGWMNRVRDAAVQPRVNIELLPRSWLRLRAGAGRVAKIPPLALLYPAPQYFDLVNVNWFATDPAERLAVITTFVHDLTNPDLGLTRATKTEVGFELDALGGTFGLTAFDDRITDAAAVRLLPAFLPRELFALTDSTPGTGRPPEIVEPAYGLDTVPVLLRRPDNHVRQTNRGLELTVTLPEITPLRLRGTVSGAWVRTERTSDQLFFGSADRFTNFQLLPRQQRTPYWSGAREIGERKLVTYRLVHHRPEIGFIITAAIQHNINDRAYDATANDTLAFEGYLTRSGELVPVPQSERTQPEYADLRVARSGVFTSTLETPGDWLLAIQVSKTLPLGGRFGFWAYNVMDNPGKFFGPNVQRRFYSPVRFGAEVFLPVSGIIGQ